MRGRIVGCMKPHQLIHALMIDKGLDASASKLAHRLRRPKMQPSIHRFLYGEVSNPAHKTAKPIADFFGIPVDALYDDRLATSIAHERGLKEPPALVPRTKKPATERLGYVDAQRIIDALRRLPAAERAEEIARLLGKANRRDKGGPNHIDEMIGDRGHDFGRDPGDSFMGDLDRIQEGKKKREQ